MNRLCSFLLLAALIATATTPRAQGGMQVEPPLDPSTVTSRSGAWSLHIEPVDRWGRTSAHYALTHDGAEAWSGNRIYALRDVTVTDSGFVTGWSNTERDGHTNHVVIFDAKGGTLLDRSWEVQPTSCMRILGEHAFNGCIAVPHADRLIVRTRIEEETSTADLWQVYRLSTGEVLLESRPANRLPSIEPPRSVVRALPLSDASLVLVQWFETDFAQRPPHFGTCFSLLDMALSPVWSLDLPHDFDAGSSDAQTALMQRVWRDSTIVGTQAGGRFELELVADAQRVTFEARGETAGAWTVREVARASTKPGAAVEGKKSVAEPDVVTLAHLLPTGVIDLLASDPSVPEVHAVCDLTVDDAGNPVFRRQEHGAPKIDVIRISPDGVRLAGADLTPPDDEGWTWDHLCWLPGDKVIAGWKHAWRDKNPAHTDLYEISLANGERRRLSTSISVELRGLERMPGGGFVALGDNVLYAFDDKGEVRWKRTSEDKLCGAYTLTVQPSGRIVLGEGGGNDGIQYVLPDGKVREYLHLVPSKGHELPYLGSPTCDVEGRLVVGAERGFCTVDAHGQLSPPIEIRSADGLPLDCRDPVSDGHGRFWAEHNRTLVRFDEQGKIDRTLGDPLATDALRDIDSVRIAENGTIHVLSQDNRLIARIDAEGKRLVTVHLAGPGFDGRELHYDTPFAVGHDGSTWISPDSKSWIAFDAGGARHDPTWAVGTPTSEPLFESGRDRCWLMTGDKLLLAQRDGTVVRTIEKDPQGRWLSPTSAAVAPDGSIAVKCDRNTNATSTFEILDAEGNSPRLLESKAPSDGGIAWDGKEILFASHGNLHVLDVASGRDRELVLDQPGSDEVKVQSLTLVHDGREIWIQDGGQRIYRYSRP